MYEGIGMPSPSPEWTLQNFWAPGVCTFLYFTMLLHMPEVMKNRERPKWLKKVIFFWNIVLSLGSSWAAIRIVGSMAVMDIPIIESSGDRTSALHNLVCDMKTVRTCKKS